MRRKQNGDETMEEEMTEEAIVNRIYDELKSRSFVEQLRLECIVDVKKKETYMKLQDRIKEYLTKKMSSDSWMDDDFNADVFRGQVVECGVLAITVERIVDAVVTRKLHEELKPMITKMVKDFCHSNLLSKTRQQRNTRKSGRSPRKEEACFEETASYVQKICEDTQRDSKKLFEDSFISKSLARVFNSSLQDSDDDGEVSDMSSNDGDNLQREDKHNVSNRRKRKKSSSPKKDDVELEQVVRVRRERKFNPKYSPSLYQTSKLSSSAFNGHISPTSPNNKNVNSSEAHNLVQKTPVTKPKSFAASETKLPSTNTVKSRDRTSEMKVENIHVKKEVVNGDNKLIEDSSMYFAKKSSPKPLAGNSMKATPGNRRHPITLEPLRKSSNIEDINGFVRKSARPRKLNSMIFSDTFQGSSVMMDNVLAPKSPPDAAEAKVSIKAESENSEKKDSSSNPETKPETHSSKRYDESDLYKPRPVIHSSGNRSRRA